MAHSSPDVVRGLLFRYFIKEIQYSFGLIFGGHAGGLLFCGILYESPLWESAADYLGFQAGILGNSIIEDSQNR